ncbi:MAG: ATP-binding cassette domain-containing protein [Pseudomonadota bacterium]|nr:ATP-binding cassette domain-containing protein [Pseudomonadota bacterium]
MMLINAKNVQLAFGLKPLLDHVDFTLQARERVALIGRNGEGKTSFLKVLTQKIKPDDGELVFDDGLSFAILDQSVPEGDDATVFEMVADAKKEALNAIKTYQTLSQKPEITPFEQQHIDQLLNLIDQENAWVIEHQVTQVLQQLELDGRAVFADLSGGRKRRVMLAKALFTQPDILFLDEPTNHLDIESIDQLESILLGFEGALFFISHDRAFIDKVATRIIELDRGQLANFNGNYAYYQEKKQQQLDAEDKANSEFDKKLAQEEVWIRQGIKARRTRNEGRVRALKKMREERKQRRETVGSANMKLAVTSRSGKNIVEATDVGYRWGEQWLFRELNTHILRGDKVGIIGPNGAGKTTLVRLLLNQLEPSEGKLKFGHNLEIAYLDQLRSQLNENLSIVDNIREGSDYIAVNGQQKHVMSYLQDFLFSSERARTPVSALSGGEKNRVLLAKLFTKPLNVLVLDEPTNDLDIDTLELLESLLVEFDGTLLMISHDRTFLDNIATNTLVFEHNEYGDVVVNDYVGGYQDWLRQRRVITPKEAFTVDDTQSTETSNQVAPSEPAIVDKKAKKLSYKDQRELDALPEKMADLEAQIESLENQMQMPEVLANHAELAQFGEQLHQCQQALDLAMERWVELEDFA